MTISVELHSDDRTDGITRTVSIVKTGANTATIYMTDASRPDNVQSHDVYGVCADVGNLHIKCATRVVFLSADIDIAVVGQPATATISISSPIGQSTSVYSLRTGEDTRLRAFLDEAQFPALAA